YLYPVNTERFQSLVNADKVFLRHGITGMKNGVSNYGKDAPGFHTDLFLVSSDQEKEIIVRDYGYEPEKVEVTGLSRFDHLFENDVATKRHILIIPTWRYGVTNKQRFLQSEYYKRYRELIDHPRLHEWGKKYQCQIKFCL